MKKQTFLNRCLIVMICVLTGILIKSVLHIGRLEKKVKWLSQRLALVQEKTKFI